MQVAAQGFDEFAEARQAYRDANYAEAVRKFEALVADEPPALQDPALILESRKYLGAAYMFVDRRDAAERQFTLLLEQEPSYLIDVSFPSDVRTLFETVRTEVHERRRIAEEERRREEAEQRAREIERLRRQQEREMRLRDLARTETVEIQNSRWLAMLPFGVGQFQNGHETLGWILLVSEALLGAASITSAIIWNSLGDQRRLPEDSPERASAVELESNLRLFNAVSGGLFYATAVAGILDAQIRYVPYHRETRERPLPPDLEPDYDPAEDVEEPAIGVSLSPFGASFQLRF